MGLTDTNGRAFGWADENLRYWANWWKLGASDIAQLREKLIDAMNADSQIITKNSYEEEYERARAKSQTEAYAAVRQEHPAIERKLNEILNHHHGRRAHYWGKANVKQQETMTCFLQTMLLSQQAPLMTNSDAGLLHVAAWLAVCTLLLAPPALRIDLALLSAYC